MTIYLITEDSPENPQTKMIVYVCESCEKDFIPTIVDRLSLSNPNVKKLGSTGVL